jgi:hypothetical protein
MAVYLHEKRLEEKWLARAAQREAQRQQKGIMNEEKEDNPMLREQDKPTRLLYDRKIREQRKKTRQQRTLDRARKEPALETPSIPGLGNSTLVKAIAGRFKSSGIREVLISNARVERAHLPPRRFTIRH